MGRLAGVLEALSPAGHFALPKEAWRDDFYGPTERRIAEMRGEYAADAEALGTLNQLAGEPEMHRRHSGCYAHEFFVARLALRAG